MQQPPSLPFHLPSLPHPHTMAAHHDHLHQQQQQQPPLDYQPGNTMSRKCGISSSSDSCPRPSRSMSPSPSPAATTAQAAFFRRSSSSGSLLIGRRFERDPGSREDLTLARVLASCTPKSMQGQAQSAPFLDSAIVAGVPKRQFYSAFEMSEDILDEDTMDENPQQGEKKCRRLTVEQVRALEKAFDSENKLEPDRKIQLASQLGLQARQVAVWFQNRRARWKTKQMEKDYGILKKKFDSLKADRDSLLKEKEGLQAKVMQLKANGKNEEALESEPVEEALIDPTSFPEGSSITTIRRCEKPIMNATPELKENDGSSSTDDSDGSVIVNVHSPWPIEKNPSAKLPNTTDPGKPATQVADSSLLDEGDYYLERAISVAEQIYMRPIKREESCYEEESGSPFVPWEWWELS